MEKGVEKLKNKFGILFDLDGTLVQNEHQKALAFSGALERLGWKSDPSFYKDVMGTETYGSDEKTLKSVALGQGATSVVGLHVGTKRSATGFIQQSTGAVEQVEVTPALSIRSGMVGWKQY